MPEITTPWTWSFSSLTEFETCPLKMAAQRFYGLVKHEDTEATIWGTRVHAMAEAYMKGEIILDLEAFKIVEPYVRVLNLAKGVKFIEEEFCIDSEWKIVPSREKASCTAYVDLAIMEGDGKVSLFDWKSGKVKDDFTQLKFYALLFAKKYFLLNKFSCKFIWLKDGKTTGVDLTREEVEEFEKELRSRVERMQEAYENNVFPARKNGLCRGFCSFLDCPHNGRR